MSFAPLTFTGISKFSEDFQTILTRSSKIAALPAQALESDQKVVTQKMMALTQLTSLVGDFASSVKSMSTVASQKALAASSSNYSLVGAVIGDGAQPGNYTISEITSLASSASSV